MADAAEKRLEWLDEQRRKDAETLHRLEKRLQALDETLAKQDRQLQDLASENARLSALGTRINQFDDALTKHRQEVSRQLQAAEETRTQKEKAFAQARAREASDVARSLDALKADLAVLDEVREALAARREEEMRLQRTLDTLEKRIEELWAKDEEHGRWKVSAEENRRIDSKRVTEAQSELHTLRGRFESARGALDSVEDRLRRAEVRVSELTASDAERREAQALWIEQQNLREVDWQRSSREWGKRFEAFEKMAHELDERMAAYEETYRALKQQREDLDNLMQRLERRITEVGEIQRLTEDRLKQEWSSFQADDQKRWNTFKLSRDELWRDHNRLHDRIAKEIEALELGMGDSLRGVQQLGEMTQQRIQGLLGMIRDWATELERHVGEVR